MSTISDGGVAVVVVNYRTFELTCCCVDALSNERVLLPGLRVVVLDGGSADGSADQLSQVFADAQYRDWVTFIPLPINGGFGWANNEAICWLVQQPDPPKFIHLLNPDCEIEPGAVEALRDYLQSHPRTAAVGSQLLDGNGRLSGSAFSFPGLRSEFCRGARTRLLEKLLRVPPISIETQSAIDVDWTTGASVMFRVAALEEVGLFDEGFFLYFEEVELMWRLRRAGWRVAFEPGSRVRHVGGAATGLGVRRSDTRREPRKPEYWYRSRSRYFALTRGRFFAALALGMWLLGNAFWLVRHALGLAPAAKVFDHAIRDHVTKSMPKARDSRPAVRRLRSRLGQVPAWMQR